MYIYICVYIYIYMCIYIYINVFNVYKYMYIRHTNLYIFLTSHINIQHSLLNQVCAHISLEMVMTKS